MENVKDLRDELREVFKELKDGKMGLKEARSLCTVADKILKSAKYQMQYNEFIQSKNKINFLDSDE